MSGRKQKLQEVVPQLRHIYAYFWPMIRVYRRLMLGALLALGGSVLFRLLEPWPLKLFVDCVMGDQHLTISSWRTEPAQLLTILAIATVVIVILRAICDYLSNVGFFLIGNRVLVKVRDRLYRHIQHLSLSFHRASRTGELTILVTRDVSLLRDVTSTAVLPLVGSSAVLIGMVGVMFWISWRLAFLALLTLPFFWLTTARLGRRIREASRRQRQRESAMAATAVEAMTAIESIQAMGLEDKFARQFSQRNQSSQKEDLKASRYSVRLSRGIDILLGISTAIVLWFGGRLALAGELSAGDMIVFLTYLKRSFKPAQDFAKYIARLAKAAAAGERVIRVLQKQSDVRDAPQALDAPAFAGDLTFEDVQYAYDPQHPVLQGVTLHVRPGEMLAIVGPSGEGKTTLLSLALRLHDPQQGTVRIDGTDIRSYKLAQVRRQFSVVLQDSLLFADSIYENIACGAEQVSRDEVLAAAQLAQANAFICDFPDQYHTKIGERGATLSRGQRQRLAVARAAVRQSPILLLDEPTTGLDEHNARALVASLLKLAEGRTTLLVSHDLALASHADRIAFLQQGRIVELGTHDELWAQNGNYARWFNEQQQRQYGRHPARISLLSTA